MLDAQGKVQKQANDLDDLLSERVDGIVLMPLDSVIAQSWVDRAAAAGIAVVAVGSQVGDPNTRPLHEVYPRLAALVTQDEVAAGQEAGRLAMTLLPRGRVGADRDHRGRAGLPRGPAAGRRLPAGARCGARALTVSWPRSPATGRRTMRTPPVRTFSRRTRTSTCSSTRPTTWRWAVRTPRARPAPRARLVGIGGSRLAIVSLQAGRIDGTVCYEPRELGALAFDALYGDVTGRKPLHAAFITYRTPGITRTNVGACPAQW